MVNRHTALKIRKTHRYLGLFIGIQFLMWTISGLYFSWTDIDEIHGDHFKKDVPEQATFKNLIGLSELENELNVQECPPNCRPNAINEFLWEIKNPSVEHINFV